MITTSDWHEYSSIAFIRYAHSSEWIERLHSENRICRSIHSNLTSHFWFHITNINSWHRNTSLSRSKQKYTSTYIRAVWMRPNAFLWQVEYESILIMNYSCQPEVITASIMHSCIAQVILNVYMSIKNNNCLICHRNDF